MSRRPRKQSTNEIAGPRRKKALSYAPDFLVDRILHRDGLILIINKPAGLPVHRGPSGGESLEDYFDALRFGLPKPPALAHRLDRDTTGCLALGRHAKAIRKLGKLFASGAVEKTYWALSRTAPEKPSGAIDAPLVKEADKVGWRMKIADDGQAAVTTYRTLAKAPGLVLLEAKPKTGRTHQIRVHLASIGAPIIGDHLYGEAKDAEALMLHARRLIIPIQAAKPPVAVEAPPPAAMAEMIDRLSLEDLR